MHGSSGNQFLLHSYGQEHLMVKTTLTPDVDGDEDYYAASLLIPLPKKRR
jgi:hypothetical protein